VLQPGRIFEIFLDVFRRLGRRAVILAGPHVEKYREHRSEKLLITPYAPYSKLLPRGALTIHQGGVGTTAQALLGGRPMLVLPWCNDQFDNADRARRLGVADVLTLNQLSSNRAQEKIERLLNDDACSRRAREIRSKLLAEDGPARTVDALEEVYSA
jgi:UDP:flavonoid glycosyltransferase YjiC (YdhE family)